MSKVKVFLNDKLELLQEYHLLMKLDEVIKFELGDSEDKLTISMVFKKSEEDVSEHGINWDVNDETLTAQAIIDYSEDSSGGLINDPIEIGELDDKRLFLSLQWKRESKRSKGVALIVNWFVKNKRGE